MNKYELYRQELIESVVRKELDAFELIEFVIELCEKIDRLDEQLKGEGE